MFFYDFQKQSLKKLFFKKTGTSQRLFRYRQKLRLCASFIYFDRFYADEIRDLILEI